MLSSFWGYSTLGHCYRIFSYIFLYISLFLGIMQNHWEKLRNNLKILHSNRNTRAFDIFPAIFWLVYIFLWASYANFKNIYSQSIYSIKHILVHDRIMNVNVAIDFIRTVIEVAFIFLKTFPQICICFTNFRVGIYKF